jgi:hypothetical protein
MENLKDDKNEAPGPGSYYNYEKFSTMNVKHKDVKHQFFNSTEDRFKNSIFGVEDGLSSSPSKVGPGAYEVSRGTFDADPRKLHHSQVKEKTHMKRVFDVPREIKNQPGPG